VHVDFKPARKPFVVEVHRFPSGPVDSCYTLWHVRSDKELYKRDPKGKQPQRSQKSLHALEISTSDEQFPRSQVLTRTRLH
jgi:hypothetical protein